MSKFSYLLDKIDRAEFTDSPFRHVYIERFFEEEDFREILEASEIAIPVATDDRDLFAKLYSAGYKVIKFPGCTTDVDDYCKWHSQRRVDSRSNSSCEGFGVVLRLVNPQSKILSEVKEFMLDSDFKSCIARKFGIEGSSCTVDNGIQKYLDGYEISPHPDIRRKAATFMVNINNAVSSEQRDHHTHYLTFKKEYEYVRTYWEGNLDVDRCWVPWDWCESTRQQTENNSIVLFSPSDDTIHAVKASYDHLTGQRTQLYGNLWYESRRLQTTTWEQLDIVNPREEASPEDDKQSLLSRVMSITSGPVKRTVKSIIRRGEAEKGRDADNYYRRKF